MKKAAAKSQLISEKEREEEKEREIKKARERRTFNGCALCNHKIN